MKKGLLATVLCLTMAAGLMAGCGGSRSDAAAAPAESAPAAEASTVAGIDTMSESLKVGFSVAQMDANPVYWLAGVTEVCADYPNIELKTYDAQGSAETQVQQFQEMINEGFNIIVYNPADAAALDTVTEQAEAANIKTINLNMGANAVHSGNVGYPTEKLGAMCADDAFDVLGAGAKCVTIGAPLALASVCTADIGFKDEAEAKGLEVLEMQNGDWTTETANTIMRDFLSKYNNDIDVCFCHNDQMAFGAAQAVEAAGLTGKVLIYGCDGLKETKEYIKNGSMRGTCYMDNTESGRLAVKAALYALEVGTDGSKLAKTPYIMSSCHLLTEENVDDYIK